MTTNACAIMLIAACLQTPATSTPEVNELYTRAAAEIDAGQLRDAAESLSLLVESYPDSPLAAAATWHLVECRLLSGQPQRALDLLTTWQDRLTKSETIESFGKPSKQLLADLKTRCYVELAKQAEAEQDQIVAMRHLLEIPEEQSLVQTTKLLGELVRLAISDYEQRLATNASHEDGFDGLWKLLTSSNMTASQQQTIRFAIAEYCNTHGHYDLARTQWTRLADELDAELPPAWAATVWLRQSENLVRERDYGNAKEKLDRLIERFPEFEAHHRLQYLRVRIAIAELRFDAAIEELEEISNSAAADEAIRAQSLWLSGEVYFLQHRFNKAIASYEQALACDAPDWHPRALLQSAKCYEKLNQPEQALSQYKLVVDQYGESSPARIATSRIAVLESLVSSSPTSVKR